MDSIAVGMKPEAVGQVLKDIDFQMESKLRELTESKLEDLKHNRSALESEYIYYKAHTIGVEVLKELTNWAREMFTTSPEKEFSAMWLKRNSGRLQGASGFPKQVREILLDNQS